MLLFINAYKSFNKKLILQIIKLNFKYLQIFYFISKTIKIYIKI